MFLVEENRFLNLKSCTRNAKLAITGNLDRKYVLNFDPLCLDGSVILIAELNIITQMQH